MGNVRRFTVVPPGPGRNPDDVLREIREKTAPRLAAHRARRRRRLLVQTVLRGAWAYRGRAAAVVLLLLYFLAMLAPYKGLSALMTFALIVSGTLLTIAILALHRVPGPELARVAPIQEPEPEEEPEPLPAAHRERSRFMASLRCLCRQRHNPLRHPLGGFRCADCGVGGADLEEMGFGPGSGYVRSAAGS